MTLIVNPITPEYKGQCHCAEYLAPVKTWKEIAKRHDEFNPVSQSLRIVSDTREDWSIDLFRCRDCGRYWAREFVSRINGYYFFYFVESDDSDEWLGHHNFWGGVMNTLRKKGEDDDYENSDLSLS